MPEKGFHLCQTATEEITISGKNSIVSIKTTFCPDIAGPANVVGTALPLGLQGQNLVIRTISSQVKKVEVHGDGAVANIKLVLKDGTAIEMGLIGATKTPVYSFALCSNFVGFNCNFHKKPNGSMQVDDMTACEVFEDFPFTGYSVIPGFVDLTYYLYGTSVVMPWDSTDLGCDYVETYTTSYTKDGVASSKPLGLTEDLTITDPKLTLYTTNQADLGVWTVTITGAIIMSASDSFTRTFTIKHDCLLTTITTITTPVTTHAIETTADTTSLTHADATSTARANPTYCGTKLYVISPLQSFYHLSGSDLVVDGGTVTDVNSYSITLTVSLPDWPQITALVKTIVVQITCVVQTLTFATAPASASLIVNLEAQPVNIPVVVTKFPNCNQVLTYTLTPSTHSFLRIVNTTVSGATVQISGATIADANVYSMTLKATAASTIFIQSANFDVTIICATTAFSISNPIANLSHITASTLLSTSSFSVNQTPACNYAVTFAFNYELLSQTVTTPWWSTFVEASTKFDFAATLTDLDVGAYTITTTATNPYINPATGSNWTTNFSFIFTIVSACNTSVLTDKTISNIVYGLTLTKVDTDIFFLDTIGTSHLDDTWCGPRKYTLTPSTYGWLSIAGDTMTVETSDINDTGVYPNIQLKIELQNYLLITEIIKTFQVTITCTVTALAFTTSPTANTLVTVGVTSQPFDLNWAISKTPNCLHDPTFAISPDDLPWLTNYFNAVDGQSGCLRTTGATMSHQGQYTRTLTAAIDSQSTTVTFAIEIKDPCKTAAFFGVSTPADLTITMPSAGPTAQTQDIQTDIQQSYPAVVCPFTGSLLPNLSWISWSSPTITVDHSQITLPSDIGAYAFTFEVDSQNWPAEVTNKIYSFSVEIVCIVTVLTLDSKAANIDPYVLNEGALTTTNSLDISQASACNFAYTYTHACRKDTGAGYAAITCPTWLVWDVNTRKFTMIVTAVADIGLYEVTTTTEIPQLDPVTSANRVIDSVFSINVVSDCTISTISDNFINDMSFVIGKTAELQTIPFFEDTIATGHADSNYCGARTFVLTPPEFTFAQISGSNIQIDTADPNFAGINTVKFSVSLTNFPLVPARVKTFQVVIGCGEFTTAPATTQLHVGITLQPHDIAVPIFHSSVCGPFLVFTLSVSTPSFVAYHDLTATDALVQISGALPSDHGDYLTLILTATTNGVSVQQTFDVTIIDPCSYAVFLTSPVAVPNMTVAYPGTQTIDQLVKAMTNIESNHGIVCGTSYALTSAPPLLGLTIDNLHVDASTILPTNFMEYTITIEATSVLWDGPVARQSYTFLLTITCEITSVIPAYSPVTGEHNLDWANNYSPSTFVIPSFTVTPANCYALPPDVTVVDESQTKPGYITMSGYSFTIDTTDYTLQGNKDFLVHATVPTSQFLTGKVGYVSVKMWFYMLSCKTAVMEAGTINFNVYYVIMSKPVEQNFATFIDSVGQSYGTPDLCGPRTISIFPQTDKIKTSPGSDPFVDEWTMWVYEDDMNRVGETTVTLTASFDNYPQATTASFSIKVILFDPCWTTRLEPFKLKDMSTTIGEEVVSQLFSQIKDSQAATYAVPNLCGQRSMKFLQKQGFLSIKPPNNLWGDESFFSIDLRCEFDQPVGGWTITLEVGLEKYPDVPKVYAVFEVKIFLTQSPPYFILPPPSVISVLKSTIPTRWSYDLPAIMDVNWQDRVTLTSNFGLASTFLKLEGNKIVIKDLSSEEIPLGFTMIVLTLSDDKSEVIYKVGIRILDKLEIPVEIVEEEIIDENCQVRIVTPAIAPYFVYKSGSSPIMIRFDKFELEGTEECTKGLTLQLSLKTLWKDSRFSSESDWLQYADNSISNESSNYFTISSDNIEGAEFKATVEISGKTEREEISSASISFSVTIKPDSKNKRVNVYVPPPQMRLIKMNEDGIATLYFDSPLMVFNKPTDAFIENPARFLKFEIEKNPYTRYAESPEYLDYGEVLKVRVKSFSAYRIELDLTFYNPLYISLDQFNRDALRVTIIDPTTFISAINFWTNPEIDSTSTLEIFRQMPKSDSEKVNSIEKGGKSFTAALSASMPANIFLGLSLKYLWGMVNTLQFVIFMDEWQVNWPPNASKALAMVRKFALAEFIDTKEMQQQLLEYYGLNQTQPEELNAEDEPVQSRQLQEIKAANVGVRYGRIVGQVFMTLGIIAAIVIAVTFLNKTTFFRPHLQHFKEYLKRSIFWNLFIRLYLQGFLKVTFGFGLVFYRLTARPDKPSVKELIFHGLYIAVFLVAIPICFLWLLVKNRNKLLLKKSKDQFGSLYLGIRIKEMITILCVFEFLAFRFLFVVLTFLLVPYPGILCNTYMLLNNFNIIYIGWFHPYETRTMQFVELLNMWCLHFVCYCLILLCNLLPSPEFEMNCGWFVIGLVCLIFFFNFCHMMYNTTKSIFYEWRLWTTRRRKIRVQKMKAAMRKLVEQMRQEMENQNNALINVPIPSVVKKQKNSSLEKRNEEAKKAWQTSQLLPDQPENSFHYSDLDEKNFIKIKMKEELKEEILLQPNQPPKLMAKTKQGILFAMHHKQTSIQLDKRPLTIDQFSFLTSRQDSLKALETPNQIQGISEHSQKLNCNEMKLNDRVTHPQSVEDQKCKPDESDEAFVLSYDSEDYEQNKNFYTPLAPGQGDFQFININQAYQTMSQFGQTNQVPAPRVMKINPDNEVHSMYAANSAFSNRHQSSHQYLPEILYGRKFQIEDEEVKGEQNFQNRVVRVPEIISFSQHLANQEREKEKQVSQGRFHRKGVSMDVIRLC